MTRDELEHAIRAACDVADLDEVYIIGSQSILGEYPDAPDQLRQSAEADIVPKADPALAPLLAEKIEAALGYLSTFHESFGFYVDGLTIDAATLPRGWEGRVVKVQNANTLGKAGICLGAHDLQLANWSLGARRTSRLFVSYCASG